MVAIERADEEQIVERLTKYDVQPYFAYSYPIKTKEGVKEVIGISADGAKEIAQQLGHVKAQTDVKVVEQDDYFYGIVPVTDLQRNVTLLGFARQSKYIIGEGNVPILDRLDDTAFVKALTKAQRNGILSIAPQGTIAAIVSKLDPKFIKKLTAPPTTKALTASEATPPETKTAEAPATRDEKRQIVLGLQALGKTDAEIRTFFYDATGKKGGWTKTDLRKLSAKLEELKGGQKPPQDATKEAQDFLKSLEE